MTNLECAAQRSAQFTFTYLPTTLGLEDQDIRKSGEVPNMRDSSVDSGLLFLSAWFWSC